jgi:glycosyltransferase involved in cell wall biosynthesis
MPECVSDARFLFIVAEAPNPTVIDSQVVDAVVAVAREGVRMDLLFLADPRPYFERRAYYLARRDEIAARTGGGVRVVPIPRKHTPIGAAIAPVVLAQELARSPGRLVVHARGDFSGFIASRLSRVSPRMRFVYDARGDVEGEFRSNQAQSGNHGARAERTLRRLLRLRHAAVTHADHVLCVSTPLRDKLVALHGLDPSRASVVPCVADADKFGPAAAEREALRRDLGVADRFVVVYPGRFGTWHYTDETFAVVRGLMDADPSVYFLVLTPDLDAARALAAAKLPAGRYEIRSARHDEVPRYLRAADLGVLLRAPHPLNEVACPTKFAEYVMTGLPVLISAGIGDCSGFVVSNQSGAVLDAPDPAAAVAAVAAIRREPDAARRARIAAAGAALSRQRYASELAALYRRLAGGEQRYPVAPAPSTERS